jgi:hypothetical protein
MSLLERGQEWMARLFGSKASVSAEDLCGKWRLTRVAGGAPATYRIQSLSLSIERNGRWYTETLMADSGDGMIVKASGEWRLQGSLMRHTAGTGWEVSRVVVEGGHLVITPDLTLIGKDGEPAAAEYER